MPTAAPRLDHPVPSAETQAIAAVCAVAAQLAAGTDLDATVPAALARLLPSLGAAACTVWLVADGHAVPRWSSGGVVGDARTALAAAQATDALAVDVDLAPLRAGRDVLGVIVRAPVPNGGAAAIPLATAADLLAPVIAAASRVARAAAESEAHRRFVECVVDALPLGLYVIDREHRIQLWNRKRETDMQGVSREQAIGQSIYEVLHRQPADLMRREFDEVLATGRMQQFQMESRSTGELRTYRLTKIPMRVGAADAGAAATIEATIEAPTDAETTGAAATHVVTLGEDITEWKAALERTAQSEKLAAIGQLAAGVMHEVNNPLATIAACAETMTLTIAELPTSRPAPAGFAEYLRIIDHEVHRCRGIIDGLLNFSRAKPLQRVRLGLNTVVEQTLFLLKHHGRFKRYAVRLELADDGGPTFTGDADQCTQVLMALLLNAADAIGEVHGDGDGDEAKAITIRTRGDGADAVVEIADEGQGIPRDELTKIFEPFYTTKAPGAGTGLGLSICYGIVRDHGGRIEVESEIGVGTTFRVTLPGT